MASSSASSAPVVVELPEDYRELVNIYLETRAADLEAIERALATGDFPVIHRIGHNLRGSSASYGFTGAGAIGTDLERAADAGDAAAVQVLAAQLREFFARVEVRYVAPPA